MAGRTKIKRRRKKRRNSESGVKIEFRRNEYNEAFLKLKNGLPECCKRVEELFNSQKYEKALEIVDSDCVSLAKNETDKAERAKLSYIVAKYYAAMRRFEQAEDWCRRALEFGELSFVYELLGYIEKNQNKLVDTIASKEKALRLEPGNIELYRSYGYSCMELGANDECFDVLSQSAKQMDKDRGNFVWYLLSLHYRNDITAEELCEEHVRVARKLSEGVERYQQHENEKKEDKKLRVGYISPDFRKHSVAYFFEAMLDGRDRENFEVYGYGNVQFPDSVTRRLAEKFDKYVSVWNKSDDAIAEMVRSDKVDILVDLSGHTNDSKVMVLARKAAPVQVTWLGYPDTTGLEEVDYRLTDEYADPEELHQYYTEKQVLLPGGFHCYKPPVECKEVVESPYKRNGYVTFGSFNVNQKITSYMIGVWSSILKVCEGSKMLLKLIGGEDERLKEYYYGKFAEHGISDDRIIIKGRVDRFEDHYKMYGEIDIALDTYPYNGTTTTFEALWMGVPVVSLVGEIHAARVGYSILKNLGLEFFAASSTEEYVKKAAVLALKPESFEQMRRTMRHRMFESPFMDVKGFANKVERAYREMWRRWCRDEEVKRAMRVEAAGKVKDDDGELVKKNIRESVIRADKSYRIGKRQEAVNYLLFGWRHLFKGDSEVALPDELLERWGADGTMSLYLKMSIALNAYSGMMNRRGYLEFYELWYKRDVNNAESKLRYGLLLGQTAVRNGEEVPPEAIKLLDEANEAMNNSRSKAALALCKGTDEGVVLDYDGCGINVFADIRNISTFSLIEQGDWFERGDMRMFRKLVREGDKVLDLGANVGVYSVSAARRVGDEGCVVAVEPAKDTFELLEKTGKQFGNMQTVNAAVTDRGGIGYLSQGTSSELNRLGSEEEGGEEVQLYSVDAVADEFGIEGFDVIKMDVEGHELEAIAGAKRVIQCGNPIVIYEINDGDVVNEDLIKRFSDMGYDSYYYVEGADALVKYEEGQDIDSYLLNMVAAREESIDRLRKVCEVFDSREGLAESLGL